MDDSEIGSKVRALHDVDRDLIELRANRNINDEEKAAATINLAKVASIYARQIGFDAFVEDWTLVLRSFVGEREEIHRQQQADIAEAIARRQREETKI